MKKICLLTILLLPLRELLAQESSNVKLTPSIKNVTLFLNGAEIRSSDNVTLKKGETNLVLTNLSPGMSEESIQLSLGDGVEIVSVSTREIKSDPKRTDKGAAQIE